jgi:hypothetical protein
MPDNDSGILAEFEEFLNYKREQEAQSAQEEDHEIEVWGSDGRGARAKRSAFKQSVLDQLGIGKDPDPEGDEGSKGNSGGKGNADDGKTGRKSTGKTSNATGPTSVARRYFTKPPAAK